VSFVLAAPILNRNTWRSPASTTHCEFVLWDIRWALRAGSGWFLDNPTALSLLAWRSQRKSEVPAALAKNAGASANQPNGSEPGAGLVSGLSALTLLLCGCSENKKPRPGI
jgi:hypothetical protein